jgi:hypothetical protein
LWAIAFRLNWRGIAGSGSRHLVLEDDALWVEHVVQVGRFELRVRDVRQHDASSHDMMSSCSFSKRSAERSLDVSN